MKVLEPAPAKRFYYPHIVHRGRDHDRLLDMRVTNRPLGEEDRSAAYSFWCDGAVAPDGTVTETGRKEVVRAMQLLVHPSSEACVVWGPRSCTFVTRNGAVDCDDPPWGKPIDVGAMSGVSAPVVNGAWLPLPTGSRATHLFLRRLCQDRIEVATAAPMRMAIWNDPVEEGAKDPFAGCFDEKGAFRRPKVLMGVETTGVDGSEVLGPIQPDGRDARTVRPWPALVREACVELAGSPLPADLLSAAWRSVQRGRSEEFLWAPLPAT